MSGFDNRLVFTLQPKRIEYILEGNLLEKKCKTAILLYCFHTAGVLHIFMLYITFWALEYHLIENLKLMLKENHRLFGFHFTNDDFPL